MTIIRNKAYRWRPAKENDSDRPRSLEFEDLRGRGSDDEEGPERSIYLTWTDGFDERSVLALTERDLEELVAIGRVILGTATPAERAMVEGLPADV